MKKTSYCKWYILGMTMIFLFGCSCQEEKPEKNPYDHYDFSTQYTVEEHTWRLEQRTAEKFKNELREGAIVDFAVEIVYSFYDYVSEFFLVTLEYAEMQTGEIYISAEERSSYETKYKHILGYIDKDVYKIGINGYSNFVDGRDPWTFNGYGEEKKYYGFGSCGVVKNGEMTEIFNQDAFYIPWEFSSQKTEWEERAISKSTEQWLAETIPAWNGKRY